MKKETVILYVVIAFIVGFIAGAAVGIVYMVKKGQGGVERVAKSQKPQMAPQVAEAPEPQGPNPMEVAAKVQALKDILKKDPRNLSAWVELGNLYFDTHQHQEAIQAFLEKRPPPSWLEMKCPYPKE